MKKGLIVILALVMVFVAAAPAFAEGEGPSNRLRLAHRFKLVGIVEEVDVDAGTILVSVVRYWPPIPVASVRVLIHTNEWTIFRWVKNAAVEARPPTIKDVEVGDRIAVTGFVRNGKHWARLILLGLPELPERPTPPPPPRPDATL